MAHFEMAWLRLWSGRLAWTRLRGPLGQFARSRPVGSGFCFRCVYMYMYMYMYMYVCMNVCMYVCMYTCMYVYICRGMMYMYTYTLRLCIDILYVYQASQACELTSGFRCIHKPPMRTARGEKSKRSGESYDFRSRRMLTASGHRKHQRTTERACPSFQLEYVH